MGSCGVIFGVLGGDVGCLSFGWDEGGGSGRVPCFYLYWYGWSPFSCDVEMRPSIKGDPYGDEMSHTSFDVGIVDSGVESDGLVWSLGKVDPLSGLLEVCD